MMRSWRDDDGVGRGPSTDQAVSGLPDTLWERSTASAEASASDVSRSVKPSLSSNGLGGPTERESNPRLGRSVNTWTDGCGHTVAAFDPQRSPVIEATSDSTSSLSWVVSRCPVCGRQMFGVL